MLKNFLLIGFGGMLGSMLRYLAALIFKSETFPFATLAVNIIGSFAIGLIIGYFLKPEHYNQSWRLFLATGICGGFTTFSSFSAECIYFIQQQRYASFAIYIAVSLLAGFTATFLGFYITK